MGEQTCLLIALCVSLLAFTGNCQKDPVQIQVLLHPTPVNKTYDVKLPSPQFTGLGDMRSLAGGYFPPERFFRPHTDLVDHEKLRLKYESFKERLLSEQAPIALSPLDRIELQVYLLRRYNEQNGVVLFVDSAFDEERTLLATKSVEELKTIARANMKQPMCKEPTRPLYS
eukprot:GILJ01008051.1.p1 GENE.GILJ01008051.1~~GILJ01008051.1.p1  ORF type:complete len:171 (-),score=21.95 GILJ01008051.1:167-679(-)